MIVGYNMNEKYYQEHFNEFIVDTSNANMKELYNFFEKHIKKGMKILDVGFGSARDMKYFSSKYDVYGIDIVDEFVNHAKQLGLTQVYKQSILDITFQNTFNAIWACASLLHIEKENLNQAFKKCNNALKGNGIMYCSFKYGTFIGERNGRYYIDLTEESIKEYLKDTNFKIIDILITVDVRPNRNEKWLNIILKKP